MNIFPQGVGCFILRIRIKELEDYRMGYVLEFINIW